MKRMLVVIMMVLMGSMIQSTELELEGLSYWARIDEVVALYDDVPEETIELIEKVCAEIEYLLTLTYAQADEIEALQKEVDAFHIGMAPIYARIRGLEGGVRVLTIDSHKPTSDKPEKPERDRRTWADLTDTTQTVIAIVGGTTVGLIWVFAYLSKQPY